MHLLYLSLIFPFTLSHFLSLWFSFSLPTSFSLHFTLQPKDAFLQKKTLICFRKIGNILLFPFLYLWNPFQIHSTNFTKLSSKKRICSKNSIFLLRKQSSTVLKCHRGNNSSLKMTITFVMAKKIAKEIYFLTKFDKPDQCSFDYKAKKPNQTQYLPRVWPKEKIGNILILIFCIISNLSFSGRNIFCESFGALTQE